MSKTAQARLKSTGIQVVESVARSGEVNTLTTDIVSKIHREDALYICEVCTKTFNTAADLEDHKYRHTKERLVQCQLYNRHIRVKGPWHNIRRNDINA